MKSKATRWIDISLTIFAATVALIYFGGYYWPSPIGNWTGYASMAYLLMVILAVGWSAFRFLQRSKQPDRLGE